MGRCRISLNAIISQNTRRRAGPHCKGGEAERRPAERPNAVRFFGEPARSRRRQPHRPWQFGESPFRALPGLGYRQTGTSGYRSPSAAWSRPGRRPPRDGPTPRMRLPARGLRADSAGKSETTCSVICRFGVNSASAALRALVSRLGSGGSQ